MCSAPGISVCPRVFQWLRIRSLQLAGLGWNPIFITSWLCVTSPCACWSPVACGKQCMNSQARSGAAVCILQALELRSPKWVLLGKKGGASLPPEASRTTCFSAFPGGPLDPLATRLGNADVCDCHFSSYPWRSCLLTGKALWVPWDQFKSHLPNPRFSRYLHITHHWGFAAFMTPTRRALQD